MLISLDDFSAEQDERQGSKPVVPGNIDLYNRPPVKNRLDPRKTSTVDTIGINEDGLEVVIPRVVNGIDADDATAIAHYRKTGQHLGKFRTQEEGSAFAQQLHNDYAAGKYTKPATGARREVRMSLDDFAGASEEPVSLAGPPPDLPTLAQRPTPIGKDQIDKLRWDATETPKYRGAPPAMEDVKALGGAALGAGDALLSAIPKVLAAAHGAFVSVPVAVGETIAGFSLPGHEDETQLAGRTIESLANNPLLQNPGGARLIESVAPWFDFSDRVRAHFEMVRKGQGGAVQSMSVVKAGVPEMTYVTGEHGRRSAVLPPVPEGWPLPAGTRKGQATLSRSAFFVGSVAKSTLDIAVNIATDPTLVGFMAPAPALAHKAVQFLFSADAIKQAIQVARDPDTQPEDIVTAVLNAAFMSVGPFREAKHAYRDAVIHRKTDPIAAAVGAQLDQEAPVGLAGTPRLVKSPANVAAEELKWAMYDDWTRYKDLNQLQPRRGEAAKLTPMDPELKKAVSVLARGKATVPYAVKRLREGQRIALGHGMPDEVQYLITYVEVDPKTGYRTILAEGPGNSTLEILNDGRPGEDLPNLLRDVYTGRATVFEPNEAPPPAGSVQDAKAKQLEDAGRMIDEANQPPEPVQGTGETEPPPPAGEAPPAEPPGPPVVPPPTPPGTPPTGAPGAPPGAPPEVPPVVPPKPKRELRELDENDLDAILEELGLKPKAEAPPETPPATPEGAVPPAGEPAGTPDRFSMPRTLWESHERLLTDINAGKTGGRVGKMDRLRALEAEYEKAWENARKNLSDEEYQAARARVEQEVRDGLAANTIRPEDAVPSGAEPGSRPPGRAELRRRRAAVQQAEIDARFEQLAADAKARGWTGTDEELRARFDQKLASVRELMDDQAQTHDENNILRSIARLGGIASDDGFPGEVDALWEDSTGFREGKELKNGGRGASGRLPTGKIAGVAGVMNSKGFTSLDLLREALGELPAFAHLREGDINDLLNEIEEASVRGERSAELEKFLGAERLRVGEDWWRDDVPPTEAVATWGDMPDESFRPVVEEALKIDPSTLDDTDRRTFNEIVEEGRRRGMVPTENEPPKVDVNDKGEAQPRLPGDVGDVRDQDVEPPELEFPFGLTPPKGPKGPKDTTRDLLPGPPPEAPKETNPESRYAGDNAADLIDAAKTELRGRQDAITDINFTLADGRSTPKQEKALREELARLQDLQDAQYNELADAVGEETADAVRREIEGGPPAGPGGAAQPKPRAGGGGPAGVPAGQGKPRGPSNLRDGVRPPAGQDARGAGDQDLVGDRGVEAPPEAPPELSPERQKLAEERAKLKDDAEALWGELGKNLNKLNVGVDPGEVKLVYQLVNNYIRQGVTEFRDLVFRFRDEYRRRYGKTDEDRFNQVLEAAWKRLTGEALTAKEATKEQRMPPAATERLHTVKPEAMPEVDHELVPETSRKTLFPHQLDTAARAIRQMKTGGGFVMADGTGTGKTSQELAVADYFARDGKKVLIVTPNQVLESPNWDTGEFTGSYATDSKRMGVKVKLLGDKDTLKPGEIGITTYHRLNKWEGSGGKDTVLIWDESHWLKNFGESGWGATGKRMNEEAHAVLFASATTLDKPKHLPYLERAGIDEGKGMANQMRSLGLRPTFRKIGGLRKAEWSIDPGIGAAEVYRRVSALGDRLIASGKMVKRELSMDGVVVEIKDLELPDAAHDMMATIEAGHRKNRKPGAMTEAIILQNQRRQQEPWKVQSVVDMVEEELRDGRQVVVYLHRVNKSKARDIVRLKDNYGNVIDEREEVYAESEGTAKLLREELEKRGIKDYVELHGGSDTTVQDAIERFQSGKARVLSATPEKGSTGVNLDSKGGMPARTLIIMTAPFDAPTNVQISGRVWRLLTESYPKIRYVFGDTAVDAKNSAIVSSKMKMLGAIVKGDIKKLDVKNPDFISIKDYTSGEGGLRELKEAAGETGAGWAAKHEIRPGTQDWPEGISVVSFPKKAPADVRRALRQSGYVWDGTANEWRARATEGAVRIGETVARGEVPDVLSYTPKVEWGRGADDPRIYVRFPFPPESAMRDRMATAGFRYNPDTAEWRAPRTPDAETLAHELEGQPSPQPPVSGPARSTTSAPRMPRGTAASVAFTDTAGAPPTLDAVEASIASNVREFVQGDIVPTLAEVSKDVRGSLLSIREALAPASVSPASQFMGRSFRANWSAHVQHVQRSQKVMADAFKAWRNDLRGDLPPDVEGFLAAATTGQIDAIPEKWRKVGAAVQFIDAIQRGHVDRLPEDQQDLARVLREVLEAKKQDVRAFGRLQGRGIVDYFPQIWMRPGTVDTFMAKIRGKRPFYGPQQFLHARKIQYFTDGLRAGLIPVTFNPVDLVNRKLAEMDQWITGKTIIKEGKQAGPIRLVRDGRPHPKGWKPLPEGLAEIWMKPTVKYREAYDGKMAASLETAMRALGITHERTLRSKLIPGAPRNAWGVAVQPDKVVTRFGGDVGVKMHELGHHLDWKYDLWDKIDNALRRHQEADPATGKKRWVASQAQELRDLADLRYEGKEGIVSKGFKDYVREKPEKMANLVHAMLYMPERARAVAPTAMRVLGEILDAHPELKVVKDIQSSKSLVLTEAVQEQMLNGRMLFGKYYAPPEVVRLFERHLGAGLRGNPLYDTARWANNQMNMIQLGFSGFHTATTGMEAMATRLALAIEQGSQGELGKAIRTGATTPLQVVIDLSRGSKLLKAFFENDALGNQVRTFADSVTQAGGGLGYEKFYRNSTPERMLEEWHKGNVIGAAGRSVAAAFEMPTKLVMEQWVPRLKMAAFFDAVEQEMSWLPRDATLDDVRGRLQERWDSIDNRFGELRYDNLFWNRAFLDSAMLAVRAVGWNLGNIREAAGAIPQQLNRVGLMPKPGQNWLERPRVAGKPLPLLAPKMAWLASYVILTSLAGATYQYVLGGRAVETAKDLIFPRTGRKMPNGDDERISLPGYLRDIYATTHDMPRSTLLTASHKLAPLLTTAYAIMTNEDYFGNEVWNIDDPLTQRVMDSVAFFGKQLRPFSVTSSQRRLESGGGARGVAESLVGLTPAPKHVYQSAAERQMERYQGPVRRTEDQALDADQRRKLRRALQVGGAEGARLQEEVAQSKRLTQRQIERVTKDAKTPSLVMGFRSLPLKQALHIYELADEKERDHLYRALLKKWSNADMTGEEIGAIRPRYESALKLPRQQQGPPPEE